MAHVGWVLKRLERLGKTGLDRLLGWGRRPPHRARRPDSSAVSEILVVRPHNQMGDMLLSTPLFAALRARFPRARITLLASPDNADVMVAHPNVDRLWRFDKKRFRQHPREAWRFWKSLRATPWDIVLMPTTVSFSVTSALVAWMAGGRMRVGSDGRAYGRTLGRVVFDVPVSCSWRDEHQTERNLDFARAVGADALTREPSMGLTGPERAWAQEQLAAARTEGRRILGIHPGAGKIPNRWPADRFGEVARTLASSGENRVCVMVGPREELLLEEMRPFPPGSVTFFAGRSVREVAALIGELDFLLCNDTGIMHIGAALSTPTLALFGPTDPRLWAPLSPAVRWLRAEDRRMESIGVAEVLAEIGRILGAGLHHGEARYAPGSSNP